MILVANRIFVSPEHTDVFEDMLATRVALVDTMRGFIAIQLLRPTKAGEPPSPLGPLAVQARSEGYGGKATKGQPKGESRAYHGYLAKLLTAQGKDAKCGAYSYVANGKLIGGAGVVLYPARYGVSGVMTFICNLDGVVYQKDLGPATREIASSMTTYNPDSSWTRQDVQ